jgi:hypothetical protein
MGKQGKIETPEQISDKIQLQILSCQFLNQLNLSVYDNAIFNLHNGFAKLK